MGEGAAARGSEVKKSTPVPSSYAVRRRLDARLEEAKTLPEPEQLVLLGLFRDGANRLSQHSQEPRGDPPMAA